MISSSRGNSMSTEWENKLYYGDNLDILRDHIPDEYVDLIYLDPPFNSKATYNVLFQEKDGSSSSAQIKAFDDSWEWNIESEKMYQQIIASGHQKLAQLICAMRSVFGQNDMMAYLVMMGVRLQELHRVLKETGSIYLHCDPTASHYLKLLMDAVFGVSNYRNELIWKRFNFHADAKRFGKITDRILFYSKSNNYVFKRQFMPYSQEYIQNKFVHIDPAGRKYRLDNLNPPGGRGPVYKFNGITKAWRFTEEKMVQLAKENRIYTKSKIPQLKRYLDELPGQAVPDLWVDIPPINSQAKERLGYPTQKPEDLLERIILSSSQEDSVVLDPFCGCGTAVNVAEKLQRKWIGIDITHLAIALMKYRLSNTFGEELSDYEVIGVPRDLTSAIALAGQDRYQFQFWALSLIDAHPIQGNKKGADKGIDGYVFFLDQNGDMRKIIVQVKSGHVSVSMVRDLIGTMKREKADLGTFITLENPTKPMIEEALSCGFFDPETYGSKYPQVQILRVEDLLESVVNLQFPRISISTFKKAPRKHKKSGSTQQTITFVGKENQSENLHLWQE